MTTIPWARLQPAAGTEDAFTITGGPAEAVFPQSVASGDPSPTGVVLWTRIRPDEAAAGHPVAVEVARDEAFTDVVHQAIIPATAVTAESYHTVRYDTQGLLDADATYYYRFIHGGTASRTGRCRTLPAADADIPRLKLALLTCNVFQNGYFTAMGHVADEDVDFVLHLGDMIYEYDGLESYNGKTFPGRGMALPSGEHQMVSRDDLEYTWARYRGDPHMQRMMERHTIIPTWDDHEVTNDRYFDHEAGVHQGDSGFSLNGDKAAIDRFFRDAAAAYFYWLPLRIEIDPEAEDPLDVITLYRRFSFGRLVDLWMLDERWYRTKPAAEGLPPDNPGEAWDQTSERRIDPSMSMLGPEQKQWLKDGLASSRAKWKAIGQQVQMAPLAATLPGTSIFLNLDAWDGYEAERQEIADALGAVDNAVVFTGDLHSYMVGEVKKDYNAQLPEPEGNTVAVEFMTPGVTSAGLGEIIEEGTGVGLFPGEDELVEDVTLTGNPHMRMFNSTRHGYATVEFTPGSATYAAFVVDKANSGTVNNRKLIAVYTVAAGTGTISETFRASPSGMPLAEANDLVRNADPRRAGPLAGHRVEAKDFGSVGRILKADPAQRTAVREWLKRPEVLA